ncbi:MAG: hypothetical protein J6B55_03705 [Clostridia bacterium]|nr:hypothetical protein [Clostridia bacterium]
MIYINDNLRIKKLDEKNLSLESFSEIKTKQTDPPKKAWRHCGYYGDLKSALQGALKKQLFDSVENEQTVKDLIEEIRGAEQSIFAAVSKMEK